MNNRISALAALSLVAGLLTGCGHAVTTAPVAPAVAQVAARSAAAPALPAHLCLDAVSVKRSDRTEQITIKGHDDTKVYTLEVSSFFPYYVPMYSEVVVNGRTLKLDKAISVAIDKLLHDADATGLSDKAKQGLEMALYGLDFKASHWGH